MNPTRPTSGYLSSEFTLALAYLLMQTSLFRNADQDVVNEIAGAVIVLGYGLYRTILKRSPAPPG